MSDQAETTQTENTGQPALDPAKLYSETETATKAEEKPTEPATEEKKPEEKPSEPAEPVKAEDIKLPEGVTLDPKTSEQLLSVLNDPKLSKGELASKLIDLQMQREKAAGEEQAQAFINLQNQWQDACKTDKDFGGPKYDSTLSGIGKVLNRFGDADAREAFNSTGAGNNPAIFRMMAKIAEVMTEGKLLGDVNPSNERESLEKRLYTNTGSK